MKDLISECRMLFLSSTPTSVLEILSEKKYKKADSNIPKMFAKNNNHSNKIHLFKSNKTNKINLWLPCTLKSQNFKKKTVI